MPSTNEDTLLEKEIALALRVELTATAAKSRGVLHKEWDVVEVPCPRKAGKEIWPEIVVRAALCERGPEGEVLQNVKVPELEGAMVRFQFGDVVLRTDRTATAPVLQVAIKEGCAELRLSPDQVGKWFDANTGWLRLNENLMDVFAEFADAGLGIQRGAAEPYFWFYRRKHFYFLPGVMGSTLSMIQPDGTTTPIYPTYGTAGDAGEYYADRLECDADGLPLVKTTQELLELMGAMPGTGGRYDRYLSAATVYDVRDRMVEQWHARCVSRQMPTALRPFRLVPWPYDWRLSLEGTWKQLLKDLQGAQENLRLEDDTDDQLAVGGHSTGGLILRRLAGAPEAEGLVDHAFFMNVPFQGAPKAVSVFIFGGEPPRPERFAPLVPFISQYTMQYTGANLPIMYFLSVSKMYPDTVSSLDEGIGQWLPMYRYDGTSREIEKQKFVDFCEEVGLIVRPRPPLSGLSESDRYRMADAGYDWNWRYWQNVQEAKTKKGIPLNSTDLYESWSLAVHTQYDPEVDWAEEHRTESPGPSWNVRIAADSAKFHADSEDLIGSRDINLWVFWSRGTVTCGKTICKLVAKQPFNQGALTLTKAEVDNMFTFVVKDRNKQTYYKIRLDAEGVEGDSTVPITSQIGIGTPRAQHFRPIPGNPTHVPAPNEPFVWDRVFDAIQGTVRSADIANVASLESRNIPMAY